MLFVKIVQQLSEFGIVDRPLFLLNKIKFAIIFLVVVNEGNQMGRTLPKYRCTNDPSKWNGIFKCNSVFLITWQNSAYVTVPLPFVSNNWNAVLYKASGVHSKPSNAWNSANEIRPSLLVSAMPASNVTESCNRKRKKKKRTKIHQLFENEISWLQFTLLKFSSGNNPKYLLIKSSLVINRSQCLSCDAYFWKTSRSFSVVARLISVGPCWNGKKNTIIGQFIQKQHVQNHFFAAARHFELFVCLFFYCTDNYCWLCLNRSIIFSH